MKKITLILLTSLFSLTVFGQDIIGPWNGALKVQGTQMRLVFNITKTDNGGSNALICQGSGGIVTVCQHPACNYAPCSLLPLCFGDCAGVGACVKVDNSLTSSGYLGTFH